MQHLYIASILYVPNLHTGREKGSEVEEEDEEGAIRGGKWGGKGKG